MTDKTFFIALSHLSDKYGRKTLLLVALATGYITLLFFPIVPSYYFQLFLRIVAGATNSVSTITRAVITDMTTTTETRTMAFAYQGICLYVHS